MTSVAYLKIRLHEAQVSRLNKLTLILSTFTVPVSIQDIKNRALEAGFRVPAHWNISSILGKSNGIAIRTPDGWEITLKGIENLREKGFEISEGMSRRKAGELRVLLCSIANPEFRNFIEEAVICLEYQLHRASVIMSWSASISLLRQYTAINYLSEFNKEAININPKWRPASNEDELGLMKEVDFLDCLQRISIIGKDVKLQLKNCLILRNSCAHPNSLKVEKHQVASCIEVLILNVLKPLSEKLK